MHVVACVIAPEPAPGSGSSWADGDLPCIRARCGSRLRSQPQYADREPRSMSRGADVPVGVASRSPPTWRSRGRRSGIEQQGNTNQAERCDGGNAREFLAGQVAADATAHGTLARSLPQPRRPTAKSVVEETMSPRSRTWSADSLAQCSGTTDLHGSLSQVGVSRLMGSPCRGRRSSTCGTSFTSRWSAELGGPFLVLLGGQLTSCVALGEDLSGAVGRMTRRRS